MSCIARTFGAPETVPAGKQARRRSKELHAFAQVAGHLGDQVADVREALGLHEPFDGDRPGPADAREVVAPEIDQHHVLGLVLLGAEELVLVSRRGRAGDRIDGRAPVLDLDQRLGRGTDQRQPVELEQEEVGRRD